MWVTPCGSLPRRPSPRPVSVQRRLGRRVGREAVEKAVAPGRLKMLQAAAGGLMSRVPGDAQADRISVGMSDLGTAIRSIVGPVAAGAVVAVVVGTAIGHRPGEDIVAQYRITF